MSMPTTIPATVQIKRTNLIGLVALAALLAALVTAVVLEFAVGTRSESARGVRAGRCPERVARGAELGTYLFGTAVADGCRAPGLVTTSPSHRCRCPRPRPRASASTSSDVGSAEPWTASASATTGSARRHPLRLPCSERPSATEQQHRDVPVRPLRFAHAEQRRMIGYYWLAAASWTSVRRIRPIQSEGRAALAARPSAHRCDMTRPAHATMTRADPQPTRSFPTHSTSQSPELHGMGRDVPGPHAVWRRAPAVRRGTLLVPRGIPLAGAALPLRRDDVRSRIVALNPASSRLFAVPALARRRVPHPRGYVYNSPNSITDEALLTRREAQFARRAGYYYGHWDELYARWRGEGRAATDELRRARPCQIPEVEDESIVTEGGLGTSYALLSRSTDCSRARSHLPVPLRVPQFGYAAYLIFYSTAGSVPGHLRPDDHEDGLRGWTSRAPPRRRAPAPRWAPRVRA